MYIILRCGSHCCVRLTSSPRLVIRSPGFHAVKHSGLTSGHSNVDQSKVASRPPVLGHVLSPAILCHPCSRIHLCDSERKRWSHKMAGTWVPEWLSGVENLPQPTPFGLWRGQDNCVLEQLSYPDPKDIAISSSFYIKKKKKFGHNPRACGILVP